METDDEHKRRIIDVANKIGDAVKNIDTDFGTFMAGASLFFAQLISNFTQKDAGKSEQMFWTWTHSTSVDLREHYSDPLDTLFTLENVEAIADRMILAGWPAADARECAALGFAAAEEGVRIADAIASLAGVGAGNPLVSALCAKLLALQEIELTAAKGIKILIENAKNAGLSINFPG